MTIDIVSTQFEIFNSPEFIMKRSLIALATVTFTLALTGCVSQHDVPTSLNPPTIMIDASSRQIVSGEIVTFTARTMDIYGRSAVVTWTSSGGNLVTEQDGRMARVKFDEPGMYSVRATLSTDGHKTLSDVVEVRVKPAS